MKVGMRKPSIKRSVKARTTGRIKRSIKRSVNPLYGKKGMGYIKNPEKAIKNAVYHKTTFGVSDVIKAADRATGTGKHRSGGNPSKALPGFLSVLTILIGIIWLLFSPIGILFILIGIAVIITINRA